MEVKVKVVKNEAEIARIKRENQTKANQRANNKALGQKEKVKVLPDELVPEIEIKEESMLIDITKVDLATIGVDGMYEILYLGKGFHIMPDKKVWDQIVKVMKHKEEQFFKQM